MKLRHLLFGVLAGVAFVACTNDNEPAGASPVNGGDKVATAAKYIAVDLQLPGSGATTRAIDEDGFVAATDAENAVTEAAFLFFKDGAQVADPLVINVENGVDANGDAWSPGTTNKKAPVIVIKNPTAVPEELVVLVNSGKTADDLSGKSIADLQGASFAADYATLANAEEPNFVMSNSVYVAAGNVLVGAPIGSENIKDTPEAAKADPAPVKVYVERVVAKVSVKKDTNISVDTGVEDIDVEITGFGLVNENTKSYLIKNLQTSYEYLSDWAGWNAPTYFRSYWADAYTFTAGDGTAYEDYTALDKVLYTQENTASYNNIKGTPTIVVVAATLTKGGEAVDLYKFRGVLYEQADLMTLMANSATVKQYYKAGSTEGTFVSLDASDFDLKVSESRIDPEDEAGTAEIKKYEANVYLSLKDGVTAYDAQGQPASGAKAAIEAMVETVQYWNGGATYYYVPIVQNSALEVNVKDPDAETPAYWGLFGVVRNHFYQLNIKKVQGLGTAVPDPEQVIIPEIPEDEDYYIAAELNILDWKNVTQDVNLGE